MVGTGKRSHQFRMIHSSGAGQGIEYLHSELETNTENVTQKREGGGKMGMTGVPSNRLCFMETCHIDIEHHIVKRASGWDEFGKQNTANTYMNSYIIAACIK